MKGIKKSESFKSSPSDSKDWLGFANCGSYKSSTQGSNSLNGVSSGFCLATSGTLQAHCLTRQPALHGECECVGFWSSELMHEAVWGKVTVSDNQEIEGDDFGEEPWSPRGRSLDRSGSSLALKSLPKQNRSEIKENGSWENCWKFNPGAPVRSKKDLVRAVGTAKWREARAVSQGCPLKLDWLWPRKSQSRFWGLQILECPKPEPDGH